MLTSSNWLKLLQLRSAHRTVARLRLEAMAIPFSISDTGLDLVPGIPCPEFNKHYYEHIIPEFPIRHLIQIYNWIDRPAMRLCYQRLWVTISSVIVCKPYRTILRGSTGYGGSLLSPLKPCVEHAHRIVTDGARGLYRTDKFCISLLDCCRWPEVNLWVVFEKHCRDRGSNPRKLWKLLTGTTP